MGSVKGFWPVFGRDGHNTFQTRSYKTEMLWARDETKKMQLPRPWPRRMVKTIKHHKYRSTDDIILHMAYDSYLHDK